MAPIQPTPASRSSRASGSGRLVEGGEDRGRRRTVAAGAPRPGDGYGGRATRRRVEQHPRGIELQHRRRRRAAARGRRPDRGPTSMVTRPALPATARTAPPVSKTSPRLSSRATGPVPVAERCSGAVTSSLRSVSRTASPRGRGRPPPGPRAVHLGQPGLSAWEPGRPGRRRPGPRRRRRRCRRSRTHWLGRHAQLTGGGLRPCPGAGLRQPQPSSAPCGHTCQVSNGPSRSSTRALTAASALVADQAAGHPGLVADHTRPATPAPAESASVRRAPGDRPHPSGSAR